MRKKACIVDIEKNSGKKYLRQPSIHSLSRVVVSATQHSISVGGGELFLRENWFEMSDLFSSLLIFTIIKTILSSFFFTVFKFYKHLVKWAQCIIFNQSMFTSL
jgi:hypothetical protein